MIDHIIIPGAPFAKQRPRHTKRGTTYTPKETVSFERLVAQIALQHFHTPLTGPVRIGITAIFEPAKSWSEKRRASAFGKPHTQRPDADNLAKAICDGMNRVAFLDDAQIWSLRVEKVWGEEAMTMVDIEEVSFGDT